MFLGDCGQCVTRFSPDNRHQQANRKKVLSRKPSALHLVAPKRTVSHAWRQTRVSRFRLALCCLIPLHAAVSEHLLYDAVGRSGFRPPIVLKQRLFNLSRALTISSFLESSWGCVPKDGNVYRNVVNCKSLKPRTFSLLTIGQGRSCPPTSTDEIGD
jgi:hypothetical protein